MRRIRYPRPDGPIQGTLDEQNAQYSKLSQVSVPLAPGRPSAEEYYRHEEGATVIQKRKMGMDI